MLSPYRIFDHWSLRTPANLEQIRAGDQLFFEVIQTKERRISRTYGVLVLLSLLPPLLLVLLPLLKLPLLMPLPLPVLLLLLLLLPLPVLVALLCVGLLTLLLLLCATLSATSLSTGK